MRKIFLFALSAALLSLVFFMAKSGRDMRLGLKQQGESFIEGLRIIHKKNGSRDWVLTAKRADMTDGGEKAHLTDIEMTIEKQGITLHADKGLYLMTDKRLFIEGKVVARGKNYSITSERVDVDSTGGTVKTDGSVTIEGSKFSVRGRGMELDTTEQKMRIHSDVEAVFYK